MGNPIWTSGGSACYDGKNLQRPDPLEAKMLYIENHSGICYNAGRLKDAIKPHKTAKSLRGATLRLFYSQFWSGRA